MHNRPSPRKMNCCNLSPLPSVGKLGERLLILLDLDKLISSEEVHTAR